MMAETIPFPVTGLYAGLLALLMLGLAARIPPLRFKARVGIGDGDDPALARAIRVHGNFVETVPMALVLLGLVEANGLAAPWLHALGMALVAGRVAHAAGLSRSTGPSAARTAGMVATWGVTLLTALIALAQATGVLPPA